MRIVHLTQSTTSEITGGLEYHVDYLVAALRQLGHEVIVVRTADSTGGKKSRDDNPVNLLPRWLSTLLIRLRHRWAGPCETLAMFGRRWFRFRHARRVVEQVKLLQPDLVHQHSYIGELRVCRLLLREYPLVFTNHTGAYLHLDRWRLTRRWQRQRMKRFSAVIGPSHELRPTIEHSWYVPNGVDVARFHPALAAERTALKEKYHCQGKRVFLCARRWAPTKGILYLAKALHLLPDTVRARSVFLFAGNETPGYTRYQQSVRQVLAVSGCDFRILGNLNHPDLAEQMHLADVSVLPSLMEATSLACLESMACATPVLGTHVGGLLELIQDGATGWLARPRDEKSLAVQLGRIFDLPGTGLEQVGRQAAEFVRQSYTWEVAARLTIEVYQQALDRWATQRRVQFSSLAELGAD